MGLIITNGVDFFSEEKRDAGHEVDGWPTVCRPSDLVNTCRDGRYRIESRLSPIHIWMSARIAEMTRAAAQSRNILP